MQRPSTPFLVLGGIMILLFVVGLILIAVLISRNNNSGDRALTATQPILFNQTVEAQLVQTQTQAAAFEAQTLAATTPTAASP